MFGYPPLSLMWEYDTGVVEDIDGEVVECLTRLTSRVPSGDHRSTFRTNMIWSISLCRVSAG